jgi:hypothetical protein
VVTSVRYVLYITARPATTTAFSQMSLRSFSSSFRRWNGAMHNRVHHSIFLVLSQLGPYATPFVTESTDLPLQRPFCLRVDVLLHLLPGVIPRSGRHLVPCCAVVSTDLWTLSLLLSINQFHQQYEHENRRLHPSCGVKLNDLPPFIPL